MNTEEFMIAAGIPNRSQVSKYGRMGIIHPTKVNRCNVFSQVDVDRVKAFRDRTPLPENNTELDKIRKYAAATYKMVSDLMDKHEALQKSHNQLQMEVNQLRQASTVYGQPANLFNNQTIIGTSGTTPAAIAEAIKDDREVVIPLTRTVVPTEPLTGQALIDWEIKMFGDRDPASDPENFVIKDEDGGGLDGWD